MAPDDRRQIDALMGKNNELENYFRNTIIPQLFVDGQLILRKFTPPAMKQFNLSPTDVGRPIEDVQDNFRFPTFLDNIREVMDSHNILEKEIQTTDNRWYQMNVLPYINYNTSKADGVIITFVDITARIADLKEQEKLITDHEILLDTISHDVKNALTTVLLSVAHIKNTPPEDGKTIASLVTVLERGLLKMQTVVTDLFESRKSSHRRMPTGRKLNLENIIEDVRLSLFEEIMQSGAVIKSDLRTPEIYFPNVKMRSVLYNLISNSIKYGRPGFSPEILVSAYDEDEFTVISVKDNGMGIPADKHEMIFSKYKRVETGLPGSGIGLYLVREIITLAGGKVEVHSEPGTGSEFKVYLKGGNQ